MAAAASGKTSTRCAARDAADREAAAQKDCARDCVTLLEPDGTIAYMSLTGLSAMGIADLGQVRGNAWHTLWPDAARPMLHQALCLAAEGKTASFVADVPSACGKGLRWEVTVAGVTDDSGAVHQIIAISKATCKAVRALRPY